MGADDVEITDRPPQPPTRTRATLASAAAILIATCLVAVVSAGRPDEPSAMRSDERPDPAVPSPGPPSVVDRAPTGRVVVVGDDDDPPAPTPPTDAPAVPSPPPVTTTTVAPTTTTPPPSAPAAPAELLARPVAPAVPEAPPGPPTAYPTTMSASGHLVTDVGCASGTSAGALDAFFRDRIGPVVGHDYQHVYALDGGRHLWLFQDTFIDHSGAATRLDQAAFAHNTAMVQDGACFSLLHRGTAAAPQSFEVGNGEQHLGRWFWPLGGESSGGRLRVFWAEMVKTDDPVPPDGLGWVPVRTWLATYDTATLARSSFRPAPASGVAPIYGYAVASDDVHTYLFGNSFDQNLAHQGGYHSCPCSATAMYLARVPRGALNAAPEYRTADGWSGDPGAAVAIVDRYRAENPMQPRFLDGRWVAVTKVDGYWGEELAIDVAAHPWGPWTTVSRRWLTARGGDPAMNTYHAHLMPWTDGGLVVSTSQNARDMRRDAWPRPDRYRLQFFGVAMPAAPPAEPVPSPVETTAPSTTVPETTTSTTIEATTTSTTTTTTTTTTEPAGCSTTSSSPTSLTPSTSAPCSG